MEPLNFAPQFLGGLQFYASGPNNNWTVPEGFRGNGKLLRCTGLSHYTGDSIFCLKLSVATSAISNNVTLILYMVICTFAASAHAAVFRFSLIG